MAAKHLSDPNFLEIKLNRSPLKNAVNKIISEKLKPFYNTVYQYLQIRQKAPEPFERFPREVEYKIEKSMSEIVMRRRILQETDEFKIQKPFQKRNCHRQTLSTERKKCKNMSKTLFLSKEETQLHENKEQLCRRFDRFRKLGKSFSESLMKPKKQYNLFEKNQKLTHHHYEGLELDPLMMDTAQNILQNRYKVEANKWLQNVVLSNEEQIEDLVRKKKSKYLLKRGFEMGRFKGVSENDVDQCKSLIDEDPTLKAISLNYTQDTTDVSFVKQMYETTNTKIFGYLGNRTCRTEAGQDSEQKTTRVSDFAVENKLRKTSQIVGNRGKGSFIQQPLTERAHKTQRQKQKQQTPFITELKGIKGVESRTNGILLMKEHKKLKYSNKSMNLVKMRNLRLRQK